MNDGFRAFPSNGKADCAGCHQRVVKGDPVFLLLGSDHQYYCETCAFPELKPPPKAEPPEQAKTPEKPPATGPPVTSPASPVASKEPDGHADSVRLSVRFVPGSYEHIEAEVTGFKTDLESFDQTAERVALMADAVLARGTESLVKRRKEYLAQLGGK
jgi:hypothetical protein